MDSIAKINYLIDGLGRMIDKKLIFVRNRNETVEIRMRELSQTGLTQFNVYLWIIYGSLSFRI